MHANKTKIVFMGTPALAKDILASLVKEKYNIDAVFTQSDKKGGREKKITPSPVKIFAEKNKIPVFTPEKLDDKSFAEIKKINPDLITVAAYGKILPEKILSIPKFGSLNVHASLLPKFRGPSPIQNAILTGEKETGVTIMLMDKGVDTGDILSQEKIKIEDNDTAASLSEKMSRTGAKLLTKTIPSWIEKKIIPKKQNDSAASLCQLIEKNDGKIFWTDETKDIFNKFRAFYPWPGIFSFLKTQDGAKRLKLNRISVLKKTAGEDKKLGEIFVCENDICVRASDGAIILEEIQLEGKNPMDAKTFSNGQRDFVGSVLA